jgi:DNA-binding IclR family transcriptional regulator
MNNQQRTVRSVDRAVDVLEALSRSRTVLTLAQLAAAVRAPKSTTLNIVRTLARRRLLEFDATAKTYRMGYLLAGLSSDVRDELDLRTIARPHLDRLALATREFVFLVLLDGDEIVFVEKIESSQPIRYVAVANVGTRRPLYCTAGGKLALALQPPAYVARYLTRVGLRRYTPHTITSPAVLRRELSAIRRRGYAVSNGEFLEDLTGLAVPVRQPGADAFLGALVVAGPTFRVRKRLREVLDHMQDTAAAVAADAVRFGATALKGVEGETGRPGDRAAGRRMDARLRGHGDARRGRHRAPGPHPRARARRRHSPRLPDPAGARAAPESGALTTAARARPRGRAV